MKKKGMPFTLWGSLFLCFVMGLLLNSLACNSQQTKQKPSWINSPSNVPLKGYIAAFVGTARIQGDVPSARQEAEQEARRKIAAFLKSEIRSITKNLDRQMGDLLNQNSLVSLVNNQTVTLEIIQASVQGSIPLEYYVCPEEDTVYVLVGLKAPQFLQKIAQVVETHLDEMIPPKKKALEETEKLKSQARARLDALLKKEAEKYNRR
ncbi:MAG: hypothetical protein D6785_06970 [Planctomycetota bacterium]|nr:MAG: hypothetical protein D6785_06970 [Planctomycetota bacterium]